MLGTDIDGSRKIRLGIARCLLGDQVRYDGGHKLDRYLRDVLGEYVEWVPVCPELECGMGVPREAVRLVGDVESPRLLGRKSGEDWTERMQEWGRGRLELLEKEDLCGFIFKHGSPSNAMGRMKVFQHNGGVLYTGVGIWARMVMDHLPQLPFEDDGRLHDNSIRENFITRVFTFKRWKDSAGKERTPGALVRFHSRHKMLIMAHNEKIYREMGKLVAAAGSPGHDGIYAEYLEMLLRALSYRPTVKKHVNVLTHALGHFKKDISPDEKQEMLELIEQYRNGLVPLIVPVTLLNHHVRRHGKEYLAEQFYLHPYPAELMLRNHV
ncbi:YbgA family protein [Maridesulfovibrio sp. FT414]|uniref:YbgA family protein n=1 Tax=Maridesulfovibrio sp. FT414 TaxID=2979469 RepID=UPI003D805A03